MKKYIFAVMTTLCFSQAYSQVVDNAPVKSSASHAHKKETKQAAETKVVLPEPSKASIGFNKAAENSNYDMMDLYFKQGADINCLNCVTGHIVPRQETALFRAISEENYQLADWLIQRGADINIAGIPAYQKSTGVTIAMVAANPRIVESSIPSLSMLNYAVKNGADLKAVDSDGRNALLYIQSWDFIGRNDSYIKTFDRNGSYSKTIVAFVDQLVQHGIDVNHRDKSGTSALISASNSCSPNAVRLLLSYGADPALKDKLGKSPLDFAMDRATQSGANSDCNETVKVLMNPQKVTQSPSLSGQQGVASYVGTYGGTYNGSDEGTFQANILQDGTVTLTGHSNKSGATFTGSGNVGNDGVISLGSVNTGSEFNGNVSKDGALTGAWKNTTYNQAGSFQGAKGTQVANAEPANPLQAIGGFLNGLNKILGAPQSQH